MLASVVRDLIGAYPVGGRKESPRPARAGDIALLAPTGTSLWIYEKTMEELGIPIVTQAGKGFFRRQEVHDLIAIARVIADSRDTLAFGALIRGPLVGLTEEEIADEIEALHLRARTADSGHGPEEGSPGRLTLWTDPEAVGNGVLRRTLEVLQNLSRKARQRTPYDLMVEAVEELHVNSILKARHLRGAERALANVELVLEMARAYGSRGIGDFARALWQHWNGQGCANRRPARRRRPISVSIITMHSAKGLEWPIVIPINSTTNPRAVSGFLYGRSDDTVHFKDKVFSSDGYKEIRDEEERQLRAERIRLWYVALTRARDLLLLPRQNERIRGDWFSLIDIDLDSLPSISAGGGFGGAPGPETRSSPQRSGSRNLETGGRRDLCQSAANIVGSTVPPRGARGNGERRGSRVRRHRGNSGNRSGRGAADGGPGGVDPRTDPAQVDGGTPDRRNPGGWGRRAGASRRTDRSIEP